MLVVFSKFLGEAPGDTLAPEWADKIFDGFPGSIPDYFDVVTFGQVTVTGEYLPKRYEMPHVAAYYVKNADEYTLDLLSLVDQDPDVNLADYDNDGPDGIPGSKDDDEFVDFMVLMPMSRPYDFIFKNGTGISHLRMSDIYYTNDKNSEARYIKIDENSGVIATGQSQYQAIGLICHEYSHAYGAVDLYDGSYEDGETDSGGIGWWGLMSHGLLGWYNMYGPVALSAYNRINMGCVCINNEDILDLYGVHRGIRLTDVSLIHGKVCRIWAGPREYFLIEYRRNDGTYYNRQIPRNGLLIWHVSEATYSNYSELRKVCDLECADGRYLDAGYPGGKDPDPRYGGDNLDFWAHDEEYSEAHTGNLGDVTDVFDGIRYTRFGPDTNPNSESKVTYKPTGIDIFNIHPEGEEMVFDVDAPPFKDWSEERYPQIGLALHRNNIVTGLERGASKHGNATLYLLKYGHGPMAEKLVTVTDDSLTVDALADMNQFTRQNIIVSRIFNESAPTSGTMIVRKNIPVAYFRDEIEKLGVTLDNIGLHSDPVQVQKLSLESSGILLPEAFSLNQNFPNPFNAQTVITYLLAERGPVVLEIFNVLGQKVRAIDRGYQETGSHSIIFDAGDMSTGMYFYRIKGTETSETKKFLLIR